MYTDVHTYHTYASGVLSFLFVSYKSSQGWLWFKKNMPEKNWIQMKKCATTISDGTIAKFFIEARPEVHHNTTRAHTSRYPVQTKYYYGSKQQEEAVPIYITTILYLVCTSIILPLLSLYLRRVWMIRSGYMRKHVVHVPMSRNVTTVWVLTWIPNIYL